MESEVRLMLSPSTKYTRKVIRGAMRGERQRAKVQQAVCGRCGHGRRKMAKNEVATISATFRGQPRLNVRRITFEPVCQGCLTEDEARAEGLEVVK